jgi:hypothetical protein
VSRFSPTLIATIAVLTAWLASPLVYYQGARLAMPHSQVFMLAMLSFWAAFRIAEGDQRARTWALLGFASALLVLTRNVAIIHLVWPALVVVRHLRSRRAASALLAGAVPVIVVQLLAWKALYGSWLVYTYGGERFDFGHLHVGSILFSARHGWFYWHPLLLLGTVAFLPWAWRRIEGRAWLLSLVTITLLNAAWATWWLGSSFGHRGFEVPTLFAAIGLACVWQAVSSRPSLRRVLGGVAACCIAWNLMLLALFLTQRISRQEQVTYSDSARAFIDWLDGLPDRTRSRDSSSR